ncbi:MAG: ankyrin repeat domain-containing protein [Alphaproteobacteria bacterium]
MTISPASPPFVDAARDGDIAAVRFHLAQRVDPDTADSMNRSALFHAAFAGHEDIVKLLLERHADANMEDDQGQTPFLAALEGKHFTIAALMLENGADLNMVSGRQEQSTFHWAFHMDMNEETLSRIPWLLEKGADTTRRNATRSTVLELARAYEAKWPFAAEIRAYVQEFIRTHDPAYILAQQMKQASAEMCEALRDGLPENVTVRPPMRLKPAVKLP